MQNPIFLIYVIGGMDHNLMTADFQVINIVNIYSVYGCFGLTDIVWGCACIQPQRFSESGHSIKAYEINEFCS